MPYGLSHSSSSPSMHKNHLEGLVKTQITGLTRWVSNAVSEGWVKECAFLAFLVMLTMQVNHIWRVILQAMVNWHSTACCRKPYDWYRDTENHCRHEWRYRMALAKAECSFGKLLASLCFPFHLKVLLSMQPNMAQVQLELQPDLWWRNPSLRTIHCARNGDGEVSALELPPQPLSSGRLKKPEENTFRLASTFRTQRQFKALGNLICWDTALILQCEDFGQG